MRYIVGCSIGVLSLLGFPEPAWAQIDCSLTSEQVRFAGAINALRHELAGLPPLPVIKTLTEVARLHARDQNWVFSNYGNPPGGDSEDAWDAYFLTLPELAGDAATIFPDDGSRQCLSHSWSKPTESWKTWTLWGCNNNSLIAPEGEGKATSILSEQHNSIWPEGSRLTATGYPYPASENATLVGGPANNDLWLDAVARWVF